MPLSRQSKSVFAVSSHSIIATYPPASTWRGASTMLLKAVEALAAVLGGGSMKLSGVASCPAAGEKLGAIAPFPSDCVCIWSCCGVNLSFWRRSTLGRDVPVVFVSGPLKGLWLAVRLAWLSSGTGWLRSGDLCLGVVFTACIMVVFLGKLGGTCAVGASAGRVGLSPGRNGIA